MLFWKKKKKKKEIKRTPTYITSSIMLLINNGCYFTSDDVYEVSYIGSGDVMFQALGADGTSRFISTENAITFYMA